MCDHGLVIRDEARGFTERMRGTEDRRKVLAKITRDGLQLPATLDEPLRDAAKQALGHM